LISQNETHRGQTQTVRGIKTAAAMGFVLVSWQQSWARNTDPETNTETVRHWCSFTE